VFVKVEPDDLENLRPALHPHTLCKQRNEHDSATPQKLLFVLGGNPRIRPMSISSKGRDQKHHW
jgi:hypothetical protein